MKKRLFGWALHKNIDKTHIVEIRLCVCILVVCLLLDAIWIKYALLASPRWGHSSLLEHPCTGLSEKTPTDDDDVGQITMYQSIYL